MAKNCQKFRSGCLVHESSLTYIFKDINHGYRGATLKKNYLRLLPFFMAVSTYCYCEKVRRTMRAAIVSYLVKFTLTTNIYFSLDISLLMFSFKVRQVTLGIIITFPQTIQKSSLKNSYRFAFTELNISYEEHSCNALDLICLSKLLIRAFFKI